MSQKICRKCNQTKSLQEFYKSPKYSSGVSSRCKNHLDRSGESKKEFTLRITSEGIKVVE